MYGIFTNIWLIFVVKVGKYTIHGSYGYGVDPKGPRSHFPHEKVWKQHVWTSSKQMQDSCGASQVKVPKLTDSKGHVAVVGGLGIHRVIIYIYIIYCNLIYHPEVGTAVSKVEIAKVCVGRLRGHGREDIR